MGRSEQGRTADVGFQILVRLLTLDGARLGHDELLAIGARTDNDTHDFSPIVRTIAVRLVVRTTSQSALVISCCTNLDKVQNIGPHLVIDGDRKPALVVTLYVEFGCPMDGDKHFWISFPEKLWIFSPLLVEPHEDGYAKKQGEGADDVMGGHGNEPATTYKHEAKSLGQTFIHSHCPAPAPVVRDAPLRLSTCAG
jgi:hypothetical protein